MIPTLPEEQRATFLAMELTEQLAVLYDMLRWVRGEISSIKKEQLAFEEELREVRRTREAREKLRDEDLMTTTQKIKAIIDATEAAKFNWGAWLRDKVLPQVITLIVLAMLYMTFGNRVP